MRNIPDIVQKATVICVCILLGTGCTGCIKKKVIELQRAIVSELLCV